MSAIALRFALLLSLSTLALAHGAASAQDMKGGNRPAGTKVDGKTIERGRYLAKIGGCNDCHTPGYPQSGGNVPEKEWLTGDRLGYRGDWGTTYPSNLRIYMSRIDEAKWIEAARTRQLRPPMPWFALRDMSNDDLRAIYHFVRQLGPAGSPAPAYLPPGETPKGPYVQFPMANK